MRTVQSASTSAGHMPYTKKLAYTSTRALAHRQHKGTANSTGARNTTQEHGRNNRNMTENTGTWHTTQGHSEVCSDTPLNTPTRHDV
eukprot:3482977-Pyramimonas_sp.AAC.1